MENNLTPLRFLLLSILLPTSVCFSQVSEQWVKRYNAEFKAMSVDASGNVYVTASSWSIANNLSDYVTVKYDTEGKELWTKRYNDPYNTSDDPTAIAVDPYGNVYVTGAAFNKGGSLDYTTIKYDSAGNELWLRHYGFAPDRNDYPVAILVDVSGNVYITGASNDEDWITQFATVKYDAAGNELWVKRYGSDNGYSEAEAIALDAKGNVYVTGWSGYETGSDYTTIKYDPSGNELWVKTNNGTGNGDDFGSSLAIDAQGNAYVTGRSYSGLTPNDWDFATIKYDAFGNELWVRKHNGIANDSDGASAVTVDPFGNVYVTGNSDNGESGWDYEALGWDYATIKYDKDGNELWVREYNGPGNSEDWALAIALDPLGNVYVTGSSRGNTGKTGFATIKYDREGNEVWVIRYDISYGHLPRLALDAAGNVYVGGKDFGENGNEYSIIKYVQAAPLVVNAGADKTLYLGYDPACVPLSVVVSGGTAPYSYSWNAQNGNTSNISVCPGATTTYVVAVTDAAGQQITDDVLINVIDVRCGNKNDKVLVCHKGKNTLCISKEAVADHLNHGDKPGPCANERTTAESSRLVSDSKTGKKKLTGANKLKVHVAPNPVRHGTRIYYELAVDGEVEIRILDAVGRIVSNLGKAYRKAGSYNKEWNTNSLGKGVYYYQVFFSIKGETTVETGKLVVVK